MSARLGVFVAVLLLVAPLQSMAAQITPLGPPGPWGVTVTPDAGVGPNRAVNSTNHTAMFFVTNIGSNTDTYTFTCWGTAGIGCTNVNPTSQQLAGGTMDTVIVTYNVGAAGFPQLWLRAEGNSGEASDTGHYVITVGAPLIDSLPYTWEKKDYTRCAHACFAATHAQATVPYFSLGAPRNVVLVYNGDLLNPKPFVHLNVSPDPGAAAPSEYRLQVKISGAFVTFVNGEQTLKFSYPGNNPVRIGGQFTWTGVTGVSAMDLIVSGVYSGGVVRTNVISTKFVSVNETNSAIAKGWTLAGIQRVVSQGDQSVLITEGDGSVVYFRKSGGVLVSPAGEFSKVVEGIPGGGSGWTRLFADSSKIVFNNVGLMTEIRDRFNNTTTIVYDGSNRVWQIKDPLNIAITLAYNANGLATITDPNSRVTTVTVNASRRLTGIQDPDNVSTTFGYDGTDRLSTVSDRRGHATTLGYDAQSGKLATITAPSITYVGTNGADSTGSPVATLAAWHTFGVPYGATASAPHTPPKADTVRATVTEPGGAVTRFTVNRWGTPAQITAPLGYVTTVVFDGNGLAVRGTAPSGAVDTIAYNASGLPTYLKSGPDSGVYVRYAGWSQPDSIWGHKRPVTRNIIGANGKITSSIVGGDTTRYHYDSRGRVDTIIDASGHLLHAFTYSATNGNPIKDSRPGSRNTHWFYDAYGRDSAVKAPGYATRRTIYDVVNRPILSYDGVYTTPDSTFYDALLPIRVSIKGQSHSVAYNALGWPIRRTDPVEKVDTLGHSRDGELRRWVNRRGQVTTFTYDSLHRPLKIYGSDTPTDSVVYSSFGLVIAAADSVSLETTYLGLHGRPDSVKTQLAGQTYWRRFRYLKNGLVDSIAVTGPGSFTLRRYRYDDTTFMLDSIKLGNSSTGLFFASDKTPSGRLLPGNLPITLQSSPVHDLAAQTTTAAFSSVVNRYASYDLGRRLQRHVLGTGITADGFAYDSLGRVIADTLLGYSSEPPSNPCSGTQIINENGNACSGTGTWNIGGITSFSYDQFGNRTDLSGSYGPGNRIRQFDTCTYVTDSLGDGNVLRRACGSDTVRFHWTAQSRLKAIKVVGGDSVEFAYDGGGRLVRRRVNGTPSYFLWNGASLLAELNSAGNRVAEYSYYPGLDNLHALMVDTTQYFAHTDAVGNVIALTDSTQHLARTYSYSVWGSITGGADSASFGGLDRARFKGALWMGPQVDLYYMRNRWYEPKTGRFLSEDPLGLAGGTNEYVYAADDPVNAFDPLGLCPTKFTKGPHAGEPGADAPAGTLLPDESGKMFRCGDDGKWHPAFPDTPGPGGGSGSGDGPGGSSEGPQSSESCWRYDPGLLAVVPRSCEAFTVTPEEKACVRDAGWTLVSLAMDVTGVRAAYALGRSGVGAVGFGVSWVWRGVQQAPQNVALAVAEAATQGQTPTAKAAGAHGFLGYVGGILPGVGTYLSGVDAVKSCGEPAN